MRAEVTGGLDVTTKPSGEAHPRWHRNGHLWRKLLCLLTPLALGLARIPSERCGFALVSGRFRRSGSRLAAALTPTGQEHQQEEAYTDEEIESQVGFRLISPALQGENRLIIPRFDTV
jgi:hypothetical protein